MTATLPAPSYIGTDESEWSWQQLRDYCVDRIVLRHGPQPPDKRETEIFQSFHERWGAAAALIARFALEPEHCNGVWHNAPVSVRRFDAGSDRYFAQVIIDRLTV